MQDTSPVTLSTILRRSPTPDTAVKVDAWLNGASSMLSQGRALASNDPQPFTPDAAPETRRSHTASKHRGGSTTLGPVGQPARLMMQYEEPRLDIDSNALALFEQKIPSLGSTPGGNDYTGLDSRSSSAGQIGGVSQPVFPAPPVSSRTREMGRNRKSRGSPGPSQPTSARASHATEGGSFIPCGICQDDLLLVANPLEASLLPSASSQRPRYGLRFLCPGRHMYCLDCSSTYISLKLQEPGNNPFPIPCPACPRGIKWQIDDETAKKLLKKELLDTWYSKRLLANISNTMLYCPNPKCSEAIDTSDIVLDVDRTECPACRSEICLKCRTIWHLGLSCEDAKNPLPGQEALQRLATKNQWRRCPQCRALVERSEGCNHMVCFCMAEFCFACGANYAEGGCTWTGGCDGVWKAEVDWTERAEEAAKQQGLLSRLKNLQWLGRSTESKAEEGPPRLRAWSWSKARTSPSPPPATGPDTDFSRGPRSFLPFRRLRPSLDQPRTPALDMLEIPQEWRISQNWVVVPRDSDPEDPTAVSTLTPPSNIRRNRRSAPPIIITGPSQHGHANAASVEGWEVPAHRMKPLPPLPPAPDSQDHEHR